mgnify:CR=1 FL=1|jgi:hypothetical protein
MGGRSYFGPVYSGPMTCISDLNKAMRWLVSQPPIPSAMLNNSPCAIGETVEAALGIPPSTVRVDLSLSDGSVELKSSRSTSSTPKSEATTTFQFIAGKPFSGKSNSDVYKQFIKKYGWKSDGSGSATLSSGSVRSFRKGKNYHNRVNLYHTTNATPHRITDLYLDYDSKKDRIWVCHLNDGKLLYYDQSNIDAIKSKYKLQYFPQATPLMINGHTHFDFYQVDSLTTTMHPFTVQTIWDEIQKGNQIIEFRAHLCDNIYCPNAGSSQCGPPGHLRDRGTAFRTPKSRIDKVWKIVKIAP